MFIPSAHSGAYGDPGGGGSGPAPGDVEQWIPVVGTALSTLTGGSEREDVAALEAKLEIARTKMKTAPNTPPVLGVVVPMSQTFYKNEIKRLEAKIVAAHELAAEERSWSATQQYIAYGALAFTAVAVIALGGVAAKQWRGALKQEV